MNRRKILIASGITLFTSITGCLGGKFNAERNGNEDDIHNETDGENRNNNTNNHSNDDGKYTYDESRQDPIFIENTTDSEIVVELLVVQKSDGETLIENAYKVPRRTGLEIPDIADVESEFEITAEYDGMVEEYDWTVLTCAHDKGPEVGGETALGVEITEDELQILNTGCDEAGAGENMDLTYKNHKEYKIDG